MIRSAWTPVAAAALALCGSGCISQAEYDEQVRNTETFQLLHQDLEAYVDELTAELERLRAEAETESSLAAGSLVPASVSVAGGPAAGGSSELDARRAALEARITALDEGLGNLTAIEVEGGYGFSLAENVVFASGSAELREGGAALLVELARKIAADEFQSLWVRGHSDSIPVRRAETLERYPHGNLQLSAARAVEVAALMIRDGGLPAAKVSVAGFGPSRPLADNGTPDGRALNRRVEIFVIQDSESGDLSGGF